MSHTTPSDTPEVRAWPPKRVITPATEVYAGEQLDTAMVNWVAAGWRVESSTRWSVALVSGRPVNHTLHALVTVLGGILTCGLLFLWAIPWIIMSVTGGERRVVLTVNPENGIVSSSEDASAPYTAGTVVTEPRPLWREPGIIIAGALLLSFVVLTIIGVAVS